MSRTGLGNITSIGNVAPLGRRGKAYDDLLHGAHDLISGELFQERAILTLGRDYLDKNTTHVLIRKTDEKDNYVEGKDVALLAGVKRLTNQPFFDRWSEAEVREHGLQKVGYKKTPLEDTSGMNIITQKLDADSMRELMAGANVFYGLGDKRYEGYNAVQFVPADDVDDADIPEDFDSNAVYGMTFVNGVQPLNYHDWPTWVEKGAQGVGLTKEHGNATGIVSAILKTHGVGKYAALEEAVEDVDAIVDIVEDE